MKMLTKIIQVFENVCMARQEPEKSCAESFWRTKWSPRKCHFMVTLADRYCHRTLCAITRELDVLSDGGNTKCIFYV